MLQSLHYLMTFFREFLFTFFISITRERFQGGYCKCGVKASGVPIDASLVLFLFSYVLERFWDRSGSIRDPLGHAAGFDRIQSGSGTKRKGIGPTLLGGHESCVWSFSVPLYKSTPNLNFTYQLQTRTPIDTAIKPSSHLIQTLVTKTTERWID